MAGRAGGLGGSVVGRRDHGGPRGTGDGDRDRPRRRALHRVRIRGRVSLGRAVDLLPAALDRAEGGGRMVRVGLRRARRAVRRVAVHRRGGRWDPRSRPGQRRHGFAPADLRLDRRAVQARAGVHRPGVSARAACAGGGARQPAPRRDRGRVRRADPGVAGACRARRLFGARRARAMGPAALRGTRRRPLHGRGVPRAGGVQGAGAGAVRAHVRAPAAEGEGGPGRDPARGPGGGSRLRLLVPRPRLARRDGPGALRDPVAVGRPEDGQSGGVGRSGSGSSRPGGPRRTRDPPPDRFQGLPRPRSR